MGLNEEDNVEINPARDARALMLAVSVIVILLLVVSVYP